MSKAVRLLVFLWGLGACTTTLTDCRENECGVCDQDSSNNCFQDCSGEWGGLAFEDECDICDEDPTNDCELLCNPNPCVNGTCTPTTATIFECICNVGSFGVICDTTWTDCKPGEYEVQSPSQALDRVCQPCDGDTYSEAINSTECANHSLCPAGFGKVEHDATSDGRCHACLGYTYSEGDNLSLCIPMSTCAFGFGASSWSSSADMTCETCDGHTAYSNVDDHSECKGRDPCPIGFGVVVDSMRDTGCVACEGETYSNTYDHKVCITHTRCGVGSGKYGGSSTSNGECKTCNVEELGTLNQYSSEEGFGECQNFTLCESGEEKYEADAHSDGECKPIPPTNDVCRMGYEGGIDGECKPCLANMTSDGLGGDCIPCAEESQLCNTVCRLPKHGAGFDKPSIDLASPEQNEFASITTLTVAPGSEGSLYVVEQDGRILRVGKSLTSEEKEVVLDIEDTVVSIVDGGSHALELGLLGLAFHPQFPLKAFAYVNYIIAVSDNDHVAETIVSRFNVDEDGVFDTDSELRLLTIPLYNHFHVGGNLIFDLEGNLLISLGDNGTSELAQQTNNFHGSILRINVDSPDTERGTPYSIPSTNPFAEALNDSPEVYAYGFRNPWKMSLDPLTGHIWVGDVGADSAEEVNRLIPGGNYGWPYLEGDLCKLTDPSECDLLDYQPPVYTYPRSAGGGSIIGGYVYRGNEIESLKGWYIFGDFVSGGVWGFDSADEPPIEAELLLSTQLMITAFGEDEDRELYIIDLDPRPFRRVLFEAGKEKMIGRIHKIVPNTGALAGTELSLLSEMGCLGPTGADLSSTHQIFPYSIEVGLWSDGLSKKRWAAVPLGETIQIASNGHLEFPTGSFLLKEFSSDKPIETRVFVKLGEENWEGFSFKWRDDGEDAELLTAGMQAEIATNTGTLDWYFPNSVECFSCHTRASGWSLGPWIQQLNSTRTDSGLSSVTQLTRLEDGGLIDLSSTPLMTDKWPPLVEGGSSIGLRVRAYFHSNCSHCHQPGTSTYVWRSALDFRTVNEHGEFIPLDNMNLCNALSLTEFMNSHTGKLLVPGCPEESGLLDRMASIEPHLRMPPLGTRVVDNEAVELVRQWITGLAGCD